MTSDMTGDDGLPREPSPGVASLGTKQRALLCAWAFVSTALYALTAVPLRGFAEEVLGAAIGVAISAGVAWIAFGASLLIVSRRYGRVSHWFDLCLRVMGWGDVALLGGGLIVLGLATLGTLWGALLWLGVGQRVCAQGEFAAAGGVAIDGDVWHGDSGDCVESVAV